MTADMQLLPRIRLSEMREVGVTSLVFNEIFSIHHSDRTMLTISTYTLSRPRAVMPTRRPARTLVVTASGQGKTGGIHDPVSRSLVT